MTPNTIPIFTAGGVSQLRCWNPNCNHVWFQRAYHPPHKCPNCQSRHWFNPTYPFHAKKNNATKEQTPCTTATNPTDSEQSPPSSEDPPPQPSTERQPPSSYAPPEN